MGNPASVKTPIISIAGVSGSGKTTLVVKLISWFKGCGLSVGTIKHSYHPHPLDSPGKDSWRHKEAGAERSIFIGPKTMQLVSDVKEEETPVQLTEKYLYDLDLVIVEGFHGSVTEKIEVVRSERSKKPITTIEDGLIAIATDMKKENFSELDVDVLDINDEKKIAQFIAERLSLTLKGGV